MTRLFEQEQEKYDPLENLSFFRSPLSVLRQLRKISAMGWSLYPYMETVLSLLSQAVPDCGISGFYLGTSLHTRCIRKGIDWGQWMILHREGVLLPSSRSGIRLLDPLSLLSRKTSVLLHEEVLLPNWKEGFLYNEIFRHWGVDHAILVTLHNEKEYFGTISIWRSSDMPPFNRQEKQFLQSAAPVIVQGIQATRWLRPEEWSRFFPSLSPGFSSERGMALLSPSGTIQGIDEKGKNLLSRLWALEKGSEGEPGSAPLPIPFQEIVASLCSLAEEGILESHTPPVRIYTHPSGFFIKLAGLPLMDANNEGPASLVIIMEEIEPDLFHIAKLQFIWGLSNRETQVLQMLTEDRSVDEIALNLSISCASVQTVLNRIQDKAGLSSRRDLRTTLKDLLSRRKA